MFTYTCTCTFIIYVVHVQYLQARANFICTVKHILISTKGYNSTCMYVRTYVHVRTYVTRSGELKMLE